MSFSNLSSADTLADALSKLALLVDAVGEPALTTSDLTTLVNASQRATVWAPLTPYFYGDRIIPTAAQGGWYKCFTPGLSGTTEPVWNPVVPFLDPYSAGPYAAFSAQKQLLNEFFQKDGSVQWRSDGRAAGLYDVRAAANAAWSLKAARAASLVDVSLAQDRFTWSQIQKQCLEMARKYVPVGLI